MPSPEEQANARVGGRIDKYAVESLLGTGGMGAVYGARHTLTGKKVALKILHSSHADRADIVERFMREAQAASRIGHEGIVDVLDAGRDADGTPFLVLELLEGEDLDQAIEHAHVEPQRAIEIARALLSALVAAHENGIIHRDIKPENIFLTRSGGVKLLDFGIAKRVDDAANLTSTGVVLGTPHYMSPEQARGASVDARSDLWSVGAVMFAMLTGSPPFEQQNYNQLIVALTIDPVPRLADVRPELPEGVAQIVDRALSRELDRRWQRARDMLDALVALESSPETVRALASTTAIRRVVHAHQLRGTLAEATTLAPAQRPRAPLWAAGGIAVVAVAAIAVASVVSMNGSSAGPATPRLEPRVPTAQPPPAPRSSEDQTSHDSPPPAVLQQPPPAVEPHARPAPAKARRPRVSRTAGQPRAADPLRSYQ